MEAKIRVEDVVKIFGPHPDKRPLSMLRQGITKDEILAKTGHVVGVDHVSFDVYQGEVFVVMGLSGSGKSTLIRCLNRLLEPTAGHVYIEGEDVVGASKAQLQEIRRRKMAMVFQHFGLFPHRTVGQNVGYGLSVRGVGEAERQEKIEEALDMVGLAEWVDYYPHNLSGGMQQRVGLARALATESDILLMDEAFSALDPLIRRQMQDELLQLQERLHRTIVFITHDLNEALRVGSRVAIMREGAIVQIGTPTEIITEPAEEYVAKFMADVDQSRVLTAEFVMKPVTQVRANATPAIALERMNKAKVDAIYVVTPEGGADGVIVRSDLERIAAEGKGDLRRIIHANFPKTSRFTPLNNLYGLSSEAMPIAVEGENGKLLGVVYPLDILAALAETEEIAESMTATEGKTVEQQILGSGSNKNNSGSDQEVAESAVDVENETNGADVATEETQEPAEKKE